jgi:hypothetical protein
MQIISHKTIQRVFRYKLPAILAAIVIIVLAYVIVCKACIDSLIKNRTLTPCNYSNITTLDLFIVENFTPLTYGSVDFTDQLQEIQIHPKDAKLFERQLGLYWGERLQVDDVKGIRFITLLVYGEKRLDKLLDEAIDYLYSGYIEEKSKNPTIN